jgi:hypothetical protein
MIPGEDRQDFGVGPTAELNLRVSVATLARVVFSDPGHGEPLLALEHKATLLPDCGEPRVVVMAQPFGGAIRILNFARLQALTTSLHFDSPRSRSESDFRIYIKPSDWEVVRNFCFEDFKREQDSDLETDPARELVEEFDDALGLNLGPEQYVVNPVATVLENEPRGSRNVQAAGVPTVRIYRVFEAQIVDSALCEAMLVNSEAHPPEVLRGLALDDAQKGGRGRANAILVTPMHRLRAAYLALSPVRRHEPLLFENAMLNGNVAAVLEGIVVPAYQTIT